MMKKKSSMMRVASVMLVLSLALSCAVFGTMAKYASQTTGSDKVSVAKWEFEINDKNFTDSETADDAIPFDLFAATSLDEAGENVKAGLIAPGTKGQLDIVVENLSEVDAKYSVTFTETNENNIPVEYSLNGEDWTDDITTLVLKSEDIDMETGKDDYVLYWRWAFTGAESENFTASQTDVTDTALGVMAAEGTAPAVVINATIVAEQID